MHCHRNSESDVRGIKKISSPDGLRRISIERGPTGWFRFVEEVQSGTAQWEAIYVGGHFCETAEAAEKEARNVIPWARNP
jgi:hypothetical protein